MGRLDQTESQSIPDAFGIPSHYVTHFFVEPAGGGCVRLYGCEKLNGLIVPRYIAVMPVEAVLSGSAKVREMALTVMRDGWIGALH